MNDIEMGKMIKIARERKKLTQQALGDKVFVSKQAVSNWEHGRARVNEDTRKNLEELLEIKIDYTQKNVSREALIKDLSLYNDIDSLLDAAKELIGKVDIDTYEKEIRSMLLMVLDVVLGFEVYYQANMYSEDKDYETSWSFVAEDLKDILNKDDNYPIHDGYNYFKYGDLFKEKIHYMTFQIGGDLFEDFDEDGYRQGYEQQIGRLAECEGDNLLNILPSLDNSLITLFKLAILDLSNAIYTYTTAENEWA